jgi:hypothetical protein
MNATPENEGMSVDLTEPDPKWAARPLLDRLREFNRCR